MEDRAAQDELTLRPNETTSANVDGLMKRQGAAFHLGGGKKLPDVSRILLRHKVNIQTNPATTKQEQSLLLLLLQPGDKKEKGIKKGMGKLGGKKKDAPLRADPPHRSPITLYLEGTPVMLSCHYLSCHGCLLG